MPIRKIRHIEDSPHNSEICEHDRKFERKRPTNICNGADKEKSSPERFISKTNLSVIFIVLEAASFGKLKKLALFEVVAWIVSEKIFFSNIRCVCSEAGQALEQWT